jgi:hypothetical protein
VAPRATVARPMSAYDPDDWRPPPPPGLLAIAILAFMVALGFAMSQWVLR